MRAWVKTVYDRVRGIRSVRTLASGAIACLAVGVVAGGAVYWAASAPASVTAGPIGLLEVDLIVDRSETDIELYFGLPADQISQIFNAPVQILVDADGLVTFDNLLNGTWDAGDEMFAGVEARLGDETITFEAMSVMVHPTDLRLPLNDPLDGMIAVSICTAIIPGARLPLDTLYLYAGFIGYADQTDAPLELTFTETGRLPAVIEFREHRNGQLIHTERVKLQDGGTLRLG